MPKTTKIIIIILSLIIISTIIFLWLYDFPKGIDKTYNAIEFELDDSENTEETTITIKGKLKRPLLRSRTFKGHIITGTDKGISPQIFNPISI